MRTISWTFQERDEAEAAIGRLEALGVERERIVLRELEVRGIGEGKAAAQDDGNRDEGFFLSVKVSLDQAEAATRALRGGSSDMPSGTMAAGAPSPILNGAVERPRPREHSLDQTASADRSAEPLKASLTANQGSEGPPRSESFSSPPHRAPSSKGWPRILIFLISIPVVFFVGWLLGEIAKQIGN